MCASHPFAAPGGKFELEEGSVLTPASAPTDWSPA